MKYNQRVNTEINPEVLPIGWKDDGKKYLVFSMYLGAKERKLLMYKFSTVRKTANKKEIVCFLLSNYIAFKQGKRYEPVAMEILRYGKPYIIGSTQMQLFIIGSIPECFHRIATSFIKASECRYMGHALYTICTGFYNAPDRLIKEMCRIISMRKMTAPVPKSPIVLKAHIPIADYQVIAKYSRLSGMTVNELLKQVLKVACMSKKDRKNDPAQLLKVFNLYRILKQSGQPYDSQEKVEVFVYIGFGYEAKYLQKILKRRKITGRDMLRKAIRSTV